MVLLLDVLCALICVFLLFYVFTLLSNLLYTRRLDRAGEPSSFPRVSILVPARDEARCIEACVSSLLGQTYPDFEVLVLNDQSEDATGAILAGLAASDPRLVVIDGTPLPAGWGGKNHACAQLAAAATGEILLFTDADTVHDPRTLREAVAMMQAGSLGLLSLITRQRVDSFGELLLVPTPVFAVWSGIPRVLAGRTRSKLITTANGQFMMFTRKAYDRVGGHASVAGLPVEDIALAHRVQELALPFAVEDGAWRVEVHMYRSFAEGWRGFAKNYHAFLGSWPVSLAGWLWVLIVTLAPPAAIVASLASGHAPGPWALTAVAIVVALWTGAAVRGRLPGIVVALYPAINVLACTLGVWSCALAAVGAGSWKGRPAHPTVEPSRSRRRWSPRPAARALRDLLADTFGF